ncbi:MAG TPA: ABC transporter permease [Thermoanaerobaculia bacterium]|nr:ABC transporter permease [Thermoanaerobaculia bacterium]
MSVPSDVRYGLRRLNNNLGFTAVAVLCLALGIGANVTVFSIINALLLRPVPGVADPDRLVALMSKPVLLRGMAGGAFSKSLSYPDFEQYRESAHAFSGFAAYHPVVVNLVAGGEPVRVSGQVVTDNYFTTLGMESALGRLFAPGEARREPQHELIISHGLWQRLFEGRSDVLRAPVLVSGTPFTIVGVTPEGFHGPLGSGDADLWMLLDAAPLVIPSMSEADLHDRDHAWLLWFIGRLALGVDLERAQAEMDTLAHHLDETDGRGPRSVPALALYPGIEVLPWARAGVWNPLALLSGVVALLMLVVCANLGALLLVKAAARQEEIGVRLALGGTRRRLVRQLLTESVALSVIGGAFGFLLALFATEALQGVSLGQFLPPLSDLSVDGRVLAFTVGLSVAAGLLFGMAPALWASRPDVEPMLRRGSGGSADRSRLRLQEILVVGQVTVSLVLLITTGLFVRTLRNLQSVDPGFDSAQVVNLRLDLDRSRYSAPAGLSFDERLVDQVRTLHGVQHASLALTVPLHQSQGELGRIVVVSVPTGPGEPDKLHWIDLNVVSPDYFKTLRISLREGREFTSRDREGSPRVVILNEAAVRLWPEGRPLLGERIQVGEERYEIVGVAGDVRRSRLDSDPPPLLYMPLAQRYEPNLMLHVRTSGDPLAAVEPIRALVAKLDPSIPLFEVSLYDEQVRKALAQPRLLSALFGSFSLIAILVTSIGLYGTLAYSVSRRTRELGIRMALGARASEIVSLVLRRGIALTLLGLALGLGAAVWTTSVFASLLFGVTPTDPLVFLAVAFLLAMVGLAASSLPAYSATRVDPMAVIRHE